MLDKKSNAWVIAGIVSLLLFSLNSFLVATNSRLIQSFDSTIIQWVRVPLTTGKTSFFKGVTFFGEPLVVASIAVILIICLIAAKKYGIAVWATLVVGVGAGLLNKILKTIFARPRPSGVHLVTEHSFSYPSGHSMGSFLLYGCLITILFYLLKDQWLPKLSCVIAILLVLAIGVSRIYLGVHYPSDILGGFLIGFSVLAFAIQYFTAITKPFDSLSKNSSKKSNLMVSKKNGTA